VANEEKQDQYPLSFMVLAFLAFIVIATIAKHLTNANVAWGLGACSVALIVAARSRWELKEEWWFWVALGIGAALQLPLILMMPWAAPHLSGIGATIFALPGFLMALGCVFIAEKVFANRNSPK
jgi:hypothetical protein